MIHTEHQRHIDAAITSRRSIRAFLSTAVSRVDIEEILSVAARAPSGTNTQPWKVYVLTGAIKENLSNTLMKLHENPDADKLHEEEYRYYPQKWQPPYIDRRRKVGWDLYSLLNITRDDKAGMHRQHGRNYQFFGAPVGLIFTIDRDLEQGSWLDYGMFLQNIMIAARGRGLHTCPQAAFNRYHAIVAQNLGLPENEMLVCGMALGYADDKIENTLDTERAPLQDFVKFLD